VPPLQQPLGQVSESHEQVPLVVSHTLFEHAAHAAPPVPHSPGDCEEYATQVLPLQQPWGHEVALHTHSPVVVLHCWPEGHAPQALPSVPQATFVSDANGRHVLPLQQPFGHDVELQTHCPALLHSWPEAHAVQAAPPVPHCVLDSPEGATHAPEAQQPAHEEPPQLHAPFEHESPLLHAAHAAAPVPHCVADCEP
jgi:hypothetical protein